MSLSPPQDCCFASLHTPRYFLHTPFAPQVAPVVKKPPADPGHTRDVGLTPGSGRSPGVGKWQSTPVLLPEKFHGQRNLERYKESNIIELTCTNIYWLAVQLFSGVFLKNIFIYLAALGLTCSTWDLLLQYAGSVVVPHWFSCPAACGILVCQSGMEPTPHALRGGFLTTGPPR